MLSKSKQVHQRCSTLAKQQLAWQNKSLQQHCKRYNHQFQRIVPEHPTYEQVVSNFKWNIPQNFNMGVEICDKHANNKATRENVALIYDANDGKGTVQKFTFEQYKNVSNRLANAMTHRLGIKKGNHVAILLAQVRNTFFCLHLTTNS